MEDVGEDGDSDAGSGAGHDLDQLAPPLEVRGEHHGRRLPHHRVPHAEQEAVAARGRNRELLIILSNQIMVYKKLFEENVSSFKGVLFQGNSTKHTTLPQTYKALPEVSKLAAACLSR